MTGPSPPPLVSGLGHSYRSTTVRAASCRCSADASASSRLARCRTGAIKGTISSGTCPAGRWWCIAWTSRATSARSASSRSARAGSTMLRPYSGSPEPVSGRARETGPLGGGFQCARFRSPSADPGHYSGEGLPPMLRIAIARCVDSAESATPRLPGLCPFPHCHYISPRLSEPPRHPRHRVPDYLRTALTRACPTGLLSRPAVPRFPGPGQGKGQVRKWNSSSKRPTDS